MVASIAIALLILRIVGGLTIAAHGAQKLFAWFEGPGFAKISNGFHGSGLRPGWFWTLLVIVGELGGGLSVAFGFLTPLGAAGIFGAMFMAIVRSHWKNGFFNGKRGIEFPLQLLAIATAVGIAGPGTYSLDNALALNLPEQALFGILVAAAVIVDIIGLILGGQPTPAAPAAPSASTTAPASTPTTSGTVGRPS